jgi:hypothetical protein
MRFPLALALSLLLASPSFAAAPDWAAVAEEEEIVVVTNDGEGGRREITIWLAVVDGQGYIRTRDTSWREHMESDPGLVVRIAGIDYEVAASPVEDDGALYESVSDAFADKYGGGLSFFLGLMRPFLGPNHVYRIDSREAG